MSRGQSTDYAKVEVRDGGGGGGEGPAMAGGFAETIKKPKVNKNRLCSKTCGIDKIFK